MTSHIAPFILSSFRILLTTPIILLCSTIITAALDWESLNAVLTDSILHGPVLDTDYQACDLFTDANTKSNSLHGICMQTYDCSHQFCNPLQFGFNLPLYTLDARSESDISTALQFASANNIKVSVKTTGYSLQGSSTSRDSLMIWMRNFPKDNQIKINFQDSCGLDHGDVIGIGGGQNWSEVLDAVKESYNIVSPDEKTVSAAGGWLQGGGIAYNSRLYGLGIDNVVEFRVVLTDGSIVVANQCTNPDLFWSLRGGGGGTFGIVTHIHYKLHQVTPIIQVNFSIYGLQNLEPIDVKPYARARYQFLNFWMSISPTLDNRWCGGHFSHNYLHLIFCGRMEDAKTTLLNDFVQWEQNVLVKSAMRDGVWGSIFATTIYSSWYAYSAKAIRTSFIGDPTIGLVDTKISGSLPWHQISSRLIPLNEVRFNAFNVIQLYLNQDVLSSSYGLSHYFIGGAINEVLPSKTAIHPAMRHSIFSFHTKGDKASDVVRGLITNDFSGVEYNHHSVSEPDWRNACWGASYERLIEAKIIYDSDRILNCWHCVGYQGVEFPERVTTSPSTSVYPSVQPSVQPSVYPSIQPSQLNSTFPYSLPSLYPSRRPSVNTSINPSQFHSFQPSISTHPSILSSISPSIMRHENVSTLPSASPSIEIPREKPYSIFLLKNILIQNQTTVETRKCKWLRNRPISSRKRICSSKRYQVYFEEANLGPASNICFETCAPFCVKQFDSGKFIFNKITNENGEATIITKQCKWLAKKDQNFISETCKKKIDYYGYIFGQAWQVCTDLCSSCTSAV